MKVAVIGATGQLGRDVCDRFRQGGDEVCELTHSDLEISSAEQVNSVLAGVHPDVVVNTAAMHHVEKCEADPARAFLVNATGARNLALFSRESGAVLIHISTDYVFDGAQQRPYVETDLPCPLNVYGNSKLAGEFFVRVLAPKHFVVRVSALYGHNPCRAKGGLNFVELMLKLANERPEIRVVDDEYVSPTRTIDVAEQLTKLTRSADYGLYHATSEGSCSWFEFAREIIAFAGANVRLEPARPGEFPAKVPRPRYSVLENSRLKSAKLNVFRNWKDALHGYLNARCAVAGA
jgi:dTDP-4-dehydrorhamnose reductase